MFLSSPHTQQLTTSTNNTKLHIYKKNTPHFNLTYKTTHEFDKWNPNLSNAQFTNSRPWWIPIFFWNSKIKRHFLMKNNHHIHPKQHKLKIHNKKNHNGCSSRSLSFSSWSSTLKANATTKSNLLRQLTQWNLHCLNITIPHLQQFDSYKHIALPKKQIYLFISLLKTCWTTVIIQ